ncbi:MAG: hypothetical protein QOG82_2541 [Actinomycetota bacterium]|nr:hypothetical protein [Actinomycetota bacterium]
MAGDVAALAVRLDDAGTAPRPQVKAPTVLFRDDFAPGTAFKARTSDDDEGVQDETYRLLTLSGADHYVPLPREAPDRPRVLQAQDISVAVDVQVVPGDPDTWFGVFCRSGGLDADVYVADVRPDGAWTIDRRTLGTKGYIERVLSKGRAPALENPQGNAFVVHLRLDCLGQVPTSLVLSVNGTVVGMALDPSGLEPANVGMAGSSRTNIIFDNLVVAEID